jgi:deoxyadenosine/deoxycytidine kinase
VKSGKEKKYAYISIAGLLGSGKTTAAKLLASKQGFYLFEEKVNENKFLPLFYSEPKRWAFHLREKAAQLSKIKTIIKETNVVQDSPIYQDYLTYAKAQHILGNMNDNEFALYEKMFHVLNREVPVPHLIIQLDATLPEILKRIKKRARSYEKVVDEKYVELLLKLQNKWLSENPKLNIVKIDTNFLDIAENPENQKIFIEKVNSNLGKLIREPELRLPLIN